MNNWILIVLDTLRKDVFLERVAPKLDLEGFTKCHALSPSFWTTPSHASIFSGLYPSQHGVTEKPKTSPNRDYEAKLTEQPPLLQSFSKDGYNMYGLSANFFISPFYGYVGWNNFVLYTPFLSYDQGDIEDYFRYMRSNRKRRVAVELLKERKYSFLYKEIKEALMWRTWNLFDPVEMGGNLIHNGIKKLKLQEPFFLFVNLMEAHEPNYRGSNMTMDLLEAHIGRMDPIKLEKYRRGYLKKADRLAQHLSAILIAINRRVNVDRTHIIITSDHGQSLGESGLIGHTTLNFQTSLIPFLIKHPDTKNLNGIVSLTRLLGFILFGDKLDSKVAFSEQFGIANCNPYDGVKSKQEYEMVARRDRRFVEAVSLKGGILFDVNEDTTVEMLGNLTEQEASDLKEYIKNFVNL